MQQSSGDTDASKRIKQMINFIKQEANEKAEEIRLKADEEFQIEKGKILNPERLKLNQEFEKKIKDLETQSKIDLSTRLNQARLEILDKKGKLMQQIQEDASKRLGDVKKDHKKYEELLTRLIIQGLIRIDEKQVKVQCVKEDLNILQSIVDKATQDYKKIWQTQVGETSQVEVSVDNERFLPPSCVGGVVLTARQNKIVLDNTLVARLDICTESLLPIIRGHLFGVVTHEKYEEEKKH